VVLECQSSSIVLLAIATDPQGSANLIGVTQKAGIYPDRECSEAATILEDDLAGSGLEESFGDIVVAATNQALYDQICDCDEWPATVEFKDADDNTTSGVVLARVEN
jgi:hypothetical protein